MGFYIERKKLGVWDIPKISYHGWKGDKKKLKYLCTNYGGEDTLNNVEGYCSHHGIRNEKIVPETHNIMV